MYYSICLNIIIGRVIITFRPSLSFPSDRLSDWHIWKIAIHQQAHLSKTSQNCSRLVQSWQRINSPQRGPYNVLLVFVMLSVLLCFACLIFLSIFLLIILGSCSCFYLEASQTTKLLLLKSSASEQKITFLSDTKYLIKVCQYSNYFTVMLKQSLFT